MRISTVLVLATLGLMSTVGFAPAQAPGRIWHYAPNGNFDLAGTFSPARFGFDIADVSNRAQLDTLPAGVRGLVWIGTCAGADDLFKAKIAAVIDHPKLFGFNLMDDPDPTGRGAHPCAPEHLRAEADWVHAQRPGVVTFVALMNQGTSTSPAFDAVYAPDRSHVDLFSIAPYPCRIEWRSCDIDMIDRYVAVALRTGVPAERIIPTYQTFGFGAWRTDTGGRYRMPNGDELRLMLDRWQRLIPHPAFDMAYSWGTQLGAASLSQSPDLLEIFKDRHDVAKKNGG
ncbi:MULTISPECIES: hypothetical protein [unclassified Beijerinckia]|uniref:hypothetical protein n=1 Tax=unclassified Beijerinckia TaxID=2638183 RepID=UPI000897B2C3|nr:MULTISPECIES: hypothetical protein [unclassified Beijerinckia]MDH7796985.1 hypothetical protein [Beijerinckia sp. GAS462]SEC67560.1 hypothetical protein SAMN05443249_3271 [Beijerinckia sp. 28-YEA-48]